MVDQNKLKYTINKIKRCIILKYDILHILLIKLVFLECLDRLTTKIMIY